MEKEHEEVESEVEGADTDAGAELDTQNTDSGADEGTVTNTAAGDVDEKSDDTGGPKSLAEALTAGVDSVAKKGAKPEEKSKDGTDEDKAKEKDAASGKDDKSADKAEKPGDKQGKPDHVNDPIDARLAPRTQERIRSLADEVKTLREVAENNGQMIGAIMDTGATPQEFGAMVGYLGAVHSEDPAKLEAAYTLLQSELQGLALRMGKPIPEVDWLNGHQDLIDAVRGGTTTREIAIESAMHRANAKRAKAVATEKAKQTETTQATEKDTETVTAELDALGEELRASDPLYQAKYNIIVPKLQAEFKKLPPKQWKTRFLEEYARAKLPAKTPVAAVTAPAVKAKGQPLRPSAPSGGTQKAPGSALDALSSAIDGMRN